MENFAPYYKYLKCLSKSQIQLISFIPYICIYRIACLLLTYITDIFYHFDDCISIRLVTFHGLTDIQYDKLFNVFHQLFLF